MASKGALYGSVRVARTQRILALLPNFGPITSKITAPDDFEETENDSLCFHLAHFIQFHPIHFATGNPHHCRFIKMLALDGTCCIWCFHVFSLSSFAQLYPAVLYPAVLCPPVMARSCCHCHCPRGVGCDHHPGARTASGLHQNLRTSKMNHFFFRMIKNAGIWWDSVRYGQPPALARYACSMHRSQHPSAVRESLKVPALESLATCKLSIAIESQSREMPTTSCTCVVNADDQRLTWHLAQTWHSPRNQWVKAFKRLAPNTG